MAVSLPGITGVVAASLLSTGLKGERTPELGMKVASGLVLWVSSIEVKTTDRGFRGEGNGSQALAVPQFTLFQNLLEAASAQGMKGSYMPPLMLGFANGLAEAFARMLVRTRHPTVGRGSASAKFSAPPAGDPLSVGFGTEAPVGIAAVIGAGLDKTFASLVVPISIVGSASFASASGTGAGKIT